MPIKILVVDDIAFMRNIAVRTLKEHGYLPIPAEDSTAAIAALNAHQDIAVVLTDLEMPDMNGTDLFAYCRKYLGDSTPPFILITASNDMETMLAAKRNGFVDVLTKPLDMDRLDKSLQLCVPKELRDQVQMQDANSESPEDATPDPAADE